MRRRRLLQILEEAARPRGEVALEEALLARQVRLAVRRADGPGGQRAHDLDDGGDVVLGLADARSALDAQRLHVLAQAGQRPVDQESGAVVGGEGNQLAPRHPEEQLMILALGPVFAVRSVGERAGACGQIADGPAQRRTVPVQSADRGQQVARRRARQHMGQQAVRLRPQPIRVVDDGRFRHAFAPLRLSRGRSRSGSSGTTARMHKGCAVRAWWWGCLRTSVLPPP